MPQTRQCAGWPYGLFFQEDGRDVARRARTGLRNFPLRVGPFCGKGGAGGPGSSSNTKKRNNMIPRATAKDNGHRRANGCTEPFGAMGVSLGSNLT